MDYKNSMDDEIKNIFQEETQEMKLSSKTLDNIMKHRKISLGERISNFLNKELEVPLVPALLSFVIIMGISIFPKDMLTRENVEIIKINGSNIIIRTEKEVGRK